MASPVYRYRINLFKYKKVEQAAIANFYALVFLPLICLTYILLNPSAGYAAILPPPTSLPQTPAQIAPADGAALPEGLPLTLSWSATGDDYYGELWIDGVGNFPIDWQSGTEKTYTGLPAGYTYHWRIKTRTASGNSAWSSTWSFTLKPAAPSNLSTQSVSCSQVELRWVDNSANEEGYRVYRDGIQIGETYSDAVYFQDTALEMNATYTYTVRAFRESIASDESPALVIPVPLCLPLKPILISPTNNETVSSFTPTYTWQAFSGADTYRLWIGKYGAEGLYAADFTSAEANCAGAEATTCFITPAFTLGGGQHIWFIKASNAMGGKWSDGSVFTTPPPAARTTLIFPGNLGTTADFQPTYIWSSVSNATYYKLWVGDTSSHLLYAAWYTPSEAGCSKETCSVTPNYPLGKGQFTWYVLAYNPAGGEWSLPGLFNTPPAPAKPTLVSPASGTAAAAFTPTYTWSSAKTATYYKLLIAKPLGESVYANWYTPTEANCTDQICSVIPDFPLGSGQYTWFVMAYNPSGGTWSDSFILFSPIPASKPVLISPKGITTDTPITFTWQDTGNATHYKLVIKASDGSIVLMQWYTINEANCNGTTCSVTPALTASGQYTWYVKSYNPAGGEWSEGAEFNR